MIRFKRLCSDSLVPERKKKGDAGFDLYANKDLEIPPKGQELIPTGIACAIEEGWVGFVWPRSGLAVRNMIGVQAGVIDSGYRGEVQVCLINHGTEPFKVVRGSRIAQLVVCKIDTESMVCDSLDQTERGDSGFGSTGK